MRIAGYGETLHPLASTWDYALAAIMCDIKLDIFGTFHGNAFRGDAITMQVAWKNLASCMCGCHPVISNSAFGQHCAAKTFAKRVAFLIILASPSQNTQFFLVSVRYPCVSLTRFLVDVAAIIE